MLNAMFFKQDLLADIANCLRDLLLSYSWKAVNDAQCDRQTDGQNSLWTVRTKIITLIMRTVDAETDEGNFVLLFRTVFEAGDSQ